MLFWMGLGCLIAACVIWVLSDEIALGWLALSAGAGLDTGDAIISGMADWVAVVMGCLSVAYLTAAVVATVKKRKERKNENVGSDTHEGQDDGQLSQGAGDRA